MERIARIAGLVCLACLLLSFLPSIHGQVLYGSLVGNVVDPSQAAVVGARVSVSNVDTGVKWELITNAAGSFSASSIPPGTYEVSAAVEGFRTVVRRGVIVRPNDTVRADMQLEVGAVTETVQVSAAAGTLQTDNMDVRTSLASSEFQNTPVPMTRNYQNLLVTIPGMTPPQNAHSISANPSRALVLNSNGSSAQSSAVRVDGATTWNTWLPHLSGYVPTLEAIQEVNVQANSYEAELGFAGGAAVNVQIKSGTNQLHGSGFWYHNNQHLKARPYFLPRSQGQPKRILNQAGGTIGGPIVRNKLFFFASYEYTPDRQSTFRLGNVPTVAMRSGDFSGSTLPVFDPLTGNPDGSGRTQFPGNRVPSARFSPVTAKIIDLVPQPNIGAAGQLGQNYFNSGSFLYDRHTIDTKLTAQATDRLNLSARVSYLDWSFDNPPFFGALEGPGMESRGSYAGIGSGTTLSMTYSAVYTLTPSVVIDGYAGYTLLDNGVENTRQDENLGREFLGIPGTNGANVPDGGWPGFTVPGFDAYGRANNNSPWNLRLPQAQYVASVAWTTGGHNLRFGWDSLWIAQDGLEPQGSPGFFTFERGVTGQPGTANNDYNSFAAFLLGLPSTMQRAVRLETGKTRTWAHSLYARDKWQVNRKLTLSLGLRWDYFAVPARTGGRGLEILDFNTGLLSLCGVGNLPANCGFQASKRQFAPRVGLAWRPSETMVVRAGYGIAWDPINIGRNPLQTYPILSNATFPARNGFQFVNPIAQGIPEVTPPSLGDGTIPVPAAVALDLADPNFRRSYIQSWNLMIEKDFGRSWVAQAGYVANRALRLQNRWDANYGYIGGGVSSQVLNRRFGRTAVTNFFSDTGGFRSYYDSLQAGLQRRFASGYAMRFSYTWSKALGPLSGNEYGVDGYQLNTPEYWPLIAKVARNIDRTHNFNASFSAELPFGGGKRWATGGIASALAGGWQLNGLFTAYTGAPFTVVASSASLNAPGNSQIADQIKPEVEIVGSVDRWFDTTAYVPVTTARFGNSGFNQLRGPGVANLDLSVYRSFRVTERVGLQFRAEMFNVTNTPHFANPRNDASGTQFGVLNAIANTGRDGIDERFARFGLRLSF
jgi:hypothetical protein